MPHVLHSINSLEASTAGYLWCSLLKSEEYYLNLAPTITYGLKRFAFKARFMILILSI